MIKYPPNLETCIFPELFLTHLSPEKDDRYIAITKYWVNELATRTNNMLMVHVCDYQHRQHSIGRIDINERKFFPRTYKSLFVAERYDDLKQYNHNIIKHVDKIILLFNIINKDKLLFIKEE